MSSATLPAPILVSPPTGSSTLPVVELVRKDVEADRKSIRIRRGSKKRATQDCSFGKFREHIGIGAWPFFHAAKKTELTTTFTTPEVDHRALNFASEHSEFFVWNTANLRRVDRSIFSLEDFAEAGLAGRFGEAVAYLTMVKWGYVYWDRIAVLWERAVAKSGMTHPEQVKNAKAIASKLAVERPDKEPDFALEKTTGEVALMESKGSFVHPINDNPSVKDDLRNALKQIAAWSGMISPTPAKSFAIGTYFRDASDKSGDPSLIAFVDPPGSRGNFPATAELPTDWIRRGNYGAWLIGMGFPQSGNALRRGIGVELPGRQIPVVNVGGRSFAVTIEGLVLKRNRRFPGPHPMFWFDPWFFIDELRYHHLPARFWRELGVVALRVIGTELGTLRLIENSAVNPASMSLLQRDAQGGDFEPPTTGDGFAGSIFPDGTLFGQVDPEMLVDARMEEFRL